MAISDINENNGMKVGTENMSTLSTLCSRGGWVNFVFLLLSFFCSPREAQRVTMAADLHALLEV